MSKLLSNIKYVLFVFTALLLNACLDELPIRIVDDPRNNPSNSDTTRADNIFPY